MEEQRHMTMPELRAKRVRLGLSQAEAAKLMEMPQTTLSHYELARHPIPWDTRCSYEKILTLCEQGKIKYVKRKKSGPKTSPLNLLGTEIVPTSKAKKLYSVRRKLGVSLSLAAQITGLTTEKYYRKEAGFVLMTVDEYKKISSFLKTIKLQRIFGENYGEDYKEGQ